MEPLPVLMVYILNMNMMLKFNLNYSVKWCVLILALCYNCDKMGHIARDCPEPDKTCYQCGKSGHISKECDMDERVSINLNKFFFQDDSILGLGWGRISWVQLIWGSIYLD